MKLDASLSQAFETLRSELGFDVLSRVPHPENLRFQMCEERKAMHRLGIVLSDLVGVDDSEDLHYAAHTIRRYFGDELSMEPAPEFRGEVPRFLLPADSQTAQRTDTRQLALHLQQLEMPQEKIVCRVSTNLNLLQKLLNFSTLETNYLALAYAVSRQYQRTTSVSCNITLALQHVALHDDGQRNRAIALLLDVGGEEVATMLAASCRLKALRFVDTVHTTHTTQTNGVSNLCSWFVLTDEAMDVLESKHRSHNALLQAILEPEQDLNLLNDHAVPIGNLYSEFPREVAEAFECAVLQRPLKAQHIYALVRWYTGGSPALPSHYSPLAGRIGLEAVREAIKRAALDCSRANVPLDSFALMRALYDGAVGPKAVYE